jgi:hypothetical protein
MHDIGTCSPLRRWWLRLLDGERPWGAIDFRPDRYGVTRYRLVVYPPGITEMERRRLRVWRGWPLWGAALWVACEIWLTPQIGPWPALAASTAAALAGGAVSSALAGDARTQVRVLAVVTMAGYDDPATLATCRRLRSLAMTLIHADQTRALGLISPTEHEALWWQVYDEIGSDRFPTPGMHGSGRAA